MIKKGSKICLLVGVMIATISSTSAYYYQALTLEQNDEVTSAVNHIEPYIETGEMREKLVTEIRAYVTAHITEVVEKEVLLQVADEVSYQQEIIGFATADSAVPMMYRDSWAEIRGGADTETSQSGLLLDAYNTIDPTLMIALPGTTFAILGEKEDTNGNLLYRVTSREYPGTSGPVYIDSRLVTRYDDRQQEREVMLPSPKDITKTMLQALDTPYVWGGNWSQGIEELAELYPIPEDATEFVQQQWKLQGVDCSGLLYEATNGYVPRNTRLMMKMGESLDIRNKTILEISEMVQPLDIIVWPGHMMIVIEGGLVIESRHDRDTTDEGYNEGGTRILTVVDALKEAMIVSQRMPVTDYDDTTLQEDIKRFVIRRRY